LLIRSALGAAVLLAVGCGTSAPDTAPHREARITADPNPVPAGSGKGTTTISWDTGDGTPGQVYVERKGQAEKLFAQGKKGTEKATWIYGGFTYEFRLYAGKEHKQVLARVTVTGQK
jgi:hypothetical protein